MAVDGKLSASCFEVTGSLSKSQGFPKSYVSKSSEGSSLATLRRGWPTTRPVRGRRDLSMSSFKGCVICKGSSGRTRNGAGGRTCRASTCKAAYKERRARAGGDAGYTALEDMAAAFDEMMPEGTWLQELDEILGERCCELRKLSHKKRKNGPGIVSAAIPGAWQIP